MAIKLDDKLFHAVKSYGFYSLEKHNQIDEEFLERKEIFNKLSSIFKTNYILSREELRKMNIKNGIYFSNAHFSGDDELISFSRHKSYKTNYVSETYNMFGSSDVYYFDKDFGYYLRNFNISLPEDAFVDFVSNSISLMFSSELLKECVKGQYATIEHEILFKNKVSLDKLIGITFPTCYVKLAGPFFGMEEPIYDYTEYDYIHYKLLLDLLTWLRENNIVVPLVSIETGEEYRENKDFAKKLTKRFNGK